MLKRKLSKTAYDALDNALQALYKVDGDDYILDVEDDPSGDAKFEAERGRRRAAEREKDKAEKERDAALEEAGKKNVDVKAIEDAYKVKLDAQKKLTTEADGKFKTYVRDQLVTTEANKLAGELSKVAPGLLANVLKNRFDVDFSDPDKPTLYVKEADGKRGAATIDDLRKEVRDNPEYKGILVASQATGGLASKQTTAQPSRGFTGREQSPNTPAPVGARLTTGQLLDRVNARRAAKGLEVVEPGSHGTQ